MSQTLTIPITNVPDVTHDAWRHWIENAPAVTTSGGSGGGRVLLISYTFPPTGGSGVQRPAKLARYLPEFGWTVEVLAAGHERFPWHDPSLLADVPSCCHVHRVAGWEPACIARKTGRLLVNLTGKELPRIENSLYWRLARWADRVGLGNGESLWVGPAARAAVRRHRRQSFDAVISTGPPTFVHQVAARVAATTHLPWIADVRDPFVSDHDRRKPDGRKLQTLLGLERRVLESADTVVTTCETLADDFRERYPRSRIRAITNGFDREDLLAALKKNATPSSADGSCTLIAAGSFYGQRELSGLVDALERVLGRHPAWRGRVRLVVAGTLDARQRRRWETDRPEWMTLAGYLDHVSMISLVRSCACAVMIVPDCKHTRLCLPAKMFELIALPVRVLGLVPPGSETEKRLLEAGDCTVAPYEHPERMATALEGVIAAHFARRLKAARDWPTLDGYDRRSIAAAWADCLAEVCRHHGR
ncbi:MAG TPA: glycosyltransferase [Phycisphaerae bacterium]|nr:glycosyltransferase [Phycisphaerae bacterium]